MAYHPIQCPAELRPSTIANFNLDTGRVVRGNREKRDSCDRPQCYTAKRLWKSEK